MEVTTAYDVPDVVPVIAPLKKRHKPGESMRAPARPIRRCVPPARSRLTDSKNDALYPRFFDLDLYVPLEIALTLTPAQFPIVSGVRSGGPSEGPRSVSRLPPRTLTMDLTYPLHVIARVTVPLYVQVDEGTREDDKPYRYVYRHMSVGYLCHQIARAYQAIYAAHERFGVWGHGIEDLVIERLRIRDNLVEVSIGS